MSNLRHEEIFPLHAAYTAVPIHRLDIVKEYVYIYIYVFDYIQIVYELLLLPSNTVCETFLHRSGAVRNVDRVFITGAPTWR